MSWRGATRALSSSVADPRWPPARLRACSGCRSPCSTTPIAPCTRAYGFERRLGLIQQSGTVLVDRAGIVRYRRAGLNPVSALDREALLAALDSRGTA